MNEGSYRFFLSKGLTWFSLPSEKASLLSFQELNNTEDTHSAWCLQSSLPVREVLAGSAEAGPQEPE